MMTREQILAAYKRLVNDAMMWLDEANFWKLMYPAVLATHEMTCADDTEVKVSLVLDEDFATENDSEYIRVRLGGHFVEYPIQKSDPKICWFEQLTNEEALYNAVGYLVGILEGDKAHLERLMKEEGICDIDRIVFTNKGMKFLMKVPATSTLAAYGEVFHGVMALEEYCRNQREDSSPYILKRTFNTIVDRDDEYEDGIIKCRNYLLCRSKEDAECWMMPFVSLQHALVTKPSFIFVPDGFPPLICYGDGLRYMIAVHRTMQ